MTEWGLDSLMTAGLLVAAGGERAPTSETQTCPKLNLPWVESRQGLSGTLIVRIHAPHIRAIKEIECLRDELAVQRFSQSEISLETQVE